jgi:26S proteasome regulatory subunit N6
VVKAKETAVYRLGGIYKDKSLVDELLQLQKSILPLFIDLPKSKVAKIVRTLFDLTLTVQHAVQNRTKDLVDLCKFIIAWCEKESRSFLRMRIESKLADLYFRLQRYADALDVLKKLLSELKKKEDKILQVEAQLVESKVYHALENLPKSKAALTSVKTTANSIYVVPALQAEIDMMSGLIATDEKDYTTAYSYFYETFEGYRSMGDAAAGHSFKFMLFSKIMNKQSEDALNLINSAVALKYQGRDVEAMKEVAQANKQQNLLAFERCKEIYARELLGDFVIKRHFNFLYSSLLEDNLRKIIEPYSEVQIAYIAH